MLDNIVNSVGYKTTVGPVDKGKVNKAMLGQASPVPSARLAQAAFDVARLLFLHPVAPPPASPAVQEGCAAGGVRVTSADARYC